MTNNKNLDQFRDCIGKTLKEASEKHPKFKFRVTRDDNEARVGTMDYRLDRVNVETVNGLISAILSIG